jgi:lysozyme
MNRDAMLSLLIVDEGLRLDLYDDATGKQLKPGDTIKGHPTVGIGRALDVNPLSEDEAKYLCLNGIAKVERELDRALPWWRALSERRQLVLASMAYQMGAAGLRGFPKFLAAVQRQDWANAAREMLDSDWHRQTPARAERLAKMMGAG